MTARRELRYCIYVIWCLVDVAWAAGGPSSFKCWSSAGNKTDLGKQRECMPAYEKGWQWCLLRYYTDPEKADMYDRGCGTPFAELYDNVQQSVQILFGKTAHTHSKFVCIPRPGLGVVDCLCQDDLCNSLTDDSLRQAPHLLPGYGKNAANAQIYIPSKKTSKLLLGQGSVTDAVKPTTALKDPRALPLRRTAHLAVWEGKTGMMAAKQLCGFCWEEHCQFIRQRWNIWK